ncbi:YihY/virulence factor BrkB family protein [Patulibacter minatonensis]|uniref:YihY/virulence factor BrkB family protein n=1 Tax=Patulibacter minatonensis TaxID=298163 RepID=UPI000A010CB2|nr:YihY/virulence factor BrkB family protein [Patulibacter minatonensis]
MRRTWAIIKRTVVSFYDDQMTQHAAAITYYSLMSLFPAILLALSILGVVGEYPRTYDAIVRYLDDVAPPSVVRPIDESLRDAFRNKSTATTGLVLSIFLALFGTTGVLESIRRALNVVFCVEGGRSFVRRKAVDVVSTFALITLVLSTVVFVVVGRGLAEDILDLVGADESAAEIWSLLRWPAAVASALLGFSFVYYVTPDLKHRAFHLVTPGAVLGVVAWLLVSYGLSEYISNVVNIGALYGAFTGAIVVVLWLWFSSCSLLLGAELNAAISAQRTMEDRTAETLADRAASPVLEVERSARRTRLRERRRARRSGGAAVTAIQEGVEEFARSEHGDEVARDDEPTDVRSSDGPDASTLVTAADAGEPTVVRPADADDDEPVDARPADTGPVDAGPVDEAPTEVLPVTPRPPRPVGPRAADRLGPPVDGDDDRA